MNENNGGAAKPPTLPVTSPAYVPPAQPDKKSDLGWKIATGALALTTVGAVAWGVTQTSSLQGEVDYLQGTVQQQDSASQAAGDSAQAAIDELDEQVSQLATDLEALEQDAGEALAGVATEYAELKKQLAKTERAAVDMKRELEREPSDAELVASAYEETLTNLYATQDAMAELLVALVVAGEDPPDF